MDLLLFEALIICFTSIEYCLRPMFTLVSLESQTWFNIQLWNQMSSKIFDGRNIDKQSMV